MQKILIILLISVAGGKIYGQNAKDMPSVAEVIKEFYGNYSTDELGYERVLFEKRKEGWFVITQKIEDNSLFPGQKLFFYNRGTKKYLALPITKKAAATGIEPPDYLSEYELRNFDLQIYFGYRGWYKDVISELEKKKSLSENELYGLGRAYSIAAGSLLSDQSGDALLKNVWSLPLKMNCLAQKQIEEFNSVESNALSCFKELAKRNPGFETAVGKIGVKYANEVMYHDHILLTYAYDYAMNMKLPSGLYPDSVITVYRKTLENCPQNAILLSFGDNDFYPVYYLQQSEGIRRDVYLVNYNLLGLDRYIYRATQPFFESGGITLSFDTSFYAGNMNEIIYIRDSDYSIPVDDFTRLLRTRGKNSDELITLAAHNILIPLHREPEVITVAIIALNKARYLFKNHWILLDIIKNLNGRKICFTDNFIDELSGLNDYLVAGDGLYIYDN